MRLVRNIILFLVATLVGLAIFMPKLSLYYYLENKLAQNGIVIYDEKAESSISNFKLSHAKVSFQGADIAEIGNLKVTPFIVYNRIDAKNIELIGVAKQFADIEIDTLKAIHSVLKPYIVKLNLKGNFGLAEGYINLKQRVVHIDIVNEEDISKIKKFLKKSEKGWYYESKF